MWKSCKSEREKKKKSRGKYTTQYKIRETQTTKATVALSPLTTLGQETSRDVDEAPSSLCFLVQGQGLNVQGQWLEISPKAVLNDKGVGQYQFVNLYNTSPANSPRALGPCKQKCLQQAPESRFGGVWIAHRVRTTVRDED